MKPLKIYRFDLRNSGSEDVNRLPPGVKGNTALMMWKELCRSGDYETDGTTHHIDEAFLREMVRTFQIRRKKGIEVPCPLGHTHDPEAKRGRVIYLELRGKGGKTSLFGIIEFVNEEAKELLQHSDVSIEAPEQVWDGDGACHPFALEHVAFTDYPVVSGMEGFTDIQFSIIKSKGTKRMAKKRMSEVDEKQKEKEFEEEQESEEEKKLSRKKRLAKKRKFSEDDEELSEDDEELSEDDEELSEDDEELSEDDDEEFSEDDEKDKEMAKKRMGKKKCFSRSGVSFSLLKENREMKIQKLLDRGKITPAQGRLMTKMFCSPQAVSFSLRTDNNREFQNICTLLNAGISQDFGEETGIQFSNRFGDESNALVDYVSRKYQK